MKVALRLRPGDDLGLALEAWMGQRRQQAGCLISGIGSLSVAQLRRAGRRQSTTLAADLEILSLAGTLSPDGAHLHIAVADNAGVALQQGAGSGHRLGRAADPPSTLQPRSRGEALMADLRTRPNTSIPQSAVTTICWWRRAAASGCACWPFWGRSPS